MELVCAVQNYDWGVRGLKSSVAQLAKSMQPNIEVKDDQPFAELWMGTHPSGPSVFKGMLLCVNSCCSVLPVVSFTVESLHTYSQILRCCRE